MKELKVCQFCHEAKPEEELITGFFALTLPIPKYEERIDELGREDWFKKLDSGKNTYDEQKEYDELAFYDQALNTIGRGIACKDCLTEEDRLYAKYITPKEVV